MQSQSQLQVLIHTTFSCITYIRSFFPESCFTNYRLQYSPKTKGLLDLLDKGVYDAVMRRYLRSFTVYILVKDIVVESYTFNINYDKDQIYDYKKFCLCLQKLRPLPLLKSMSIKLTYTDETPSDYQPFGFKDGSGNYKYEGEVSIIKFEGKDSGLVPTEVKVGNLFKKEEAKVEVTKKLEKENVVEKESLVEKENNLNKKLEKESIVEKENNLRQNEKHEGIKKKKIIDVENVNEIKDRTNEDKDSKTEDNTDMDLQNTLFDFTSQNISAFDFTSQNTFPAQNDSVKDELIKVEEPINFNEEKYKRDEPNKAEEEINAQDEPLKNNGSNKEEIIRCTCKVSATNFDLIHCDTCHNWLHTVCCGFFSNSDKRIPETYECLFCTKEFNYLVTEKSLTRRLLAILYLEKYVSMDQLRDRMGINRNKLHQIFAKLKEQGFVRRKFKDIEVIKNEETKKKLKEYFKIKKTSITIKDIECEN